MITIQYTSLSKEKRNQIYFNDFIPMGVYLYTDEWLPGENTILYLPMKSDLLDHGPKGITITNINSVTIVNGAGYFGGASRRLSFTNTSNMSGSWTISAWYKTNSSTNQWIFTQGGASNNGCLQCGYSDGNRGLIMGFYNNDMDSGSFAGTDGLWHNVIFTYNGGGSSIIYLDGSVTKSGSLSNLSTSNNTGIIGDLSFSTGKTFNGYISEFIMENKVRTSDYISNYYNSTKSNYGL